MELEKIEGIFGKGNAYDRKCSDWSTGFFYNH